VLCRTTPALVQISLAAVLVISCDYFITLSEFTFRSRAAFRSNTIQQPKRPAGIVQVLRPSMLDARYSMLHCAALYLIAVDDSFVFLFSAALLLRCSDVQQLYASIVAPLILGARYSLLLCVCTHCSCTSLCQRSWMTVLSSNSTRLFGCAALVCNSFVNLISVYAWRPLLAVAVRVHTLYMHLIS
jgi:hypothetical protein